ncbi:MULTISPECIES: cytochrome c family protein [Micromonospora]|uniref:Cytochrome C n=1 Tax=Micromonospora solifontis TaxID=2487138 RepID=A0ABX9W9F5_9ACTN|nr:MULTISPECIES: c-type cytochrome [Micromonospora]NES16920.1 c-type cytochrome [Micromonospora sp. PPF5-17B]NES39333.1 c-type cytochrome [Micromonospora solifontis]NES58604.1 c-type cytochrome [Micromonospora sp. PPF5-6]RNL89430.1 cytochrome C [Micromonospora solifontis]
MSRRTADRWLLLVALPPLLALPGCARTNPPPPPEVRAGRPDRGAALIAQYGCGSCHTIPGVDRANGLVGPPLTRFGSRSYIAGKLVNNADNLQHWITDPQAVEPGNAMPNLGVKPIDAQDIAAYLYTLD